MRLFQIRKCLFEKDAQMLLYELHDGVQQISDGQPVDDRLDRVDDQPQKL
jgi:hypothetical protein